MIILQTMKDYITFGDRSILNYFDVTNIVIRKNPCDLALVKSVTWDILKDAGKAE